MKRFTPAFLAATTIGSKALRLTEVDSFSSSSKLASLEMQPRPITASTPCRASASFGVLRRSPWITRRLLFCFGRNRSPK